MSPTKPAAVHWDRDADGIVTLTLEGPALTRPADPGGPAAVAAALAGAAERLAAAAADLRGVVLVCRGADFHAAAGLAEILGGEPERAGRFFATGMRLKQALRRIETLGRPVVAALSGPALGGGLEIALACHHRIALDDPVVRLGLPEVTLGLVPAGGGVLRGVRLLGVATALQEVLLEGRPLSAARAAATGLVDELARDPGELDRLARAFIDAHPEARQRWDAPGYRIPGGAPGDAELAAVLPSLPALLRQRTGGAPSPAPRAILAAAVECAQVGTDAAAAVEARHATEAAVGRTAASMVGAFHFDLAAVRAGTGRPAGQPRRQAARVAVLGAGMMGAGIAAACAAAGLQVVLRDVSREAAERGRARIAQALDRAVARGEGAPARRERTLARITATADPAGLAGCDVVIEAVTEDLALKRRVLAEVQHLVAPGALLCSNTSTLPITVLAEAVARREDVVGLHFFSPVDRMPLVEVVRGERTGERALARAVDLVGQVGKMPIVVADSRGFFTSAVIGCRLNEAVAMLAEGVEPASVEQAARQAGYPLGALALLDEVSLTLARRVRDEARAAVTAEGGTWRPHPAEAVLDRMVAEFQRPGRAAGAGFYEYADGRRVRLWPGLRTHFTTPAGGAAGPPADLAELRERLLFSEALEAVRLLAGGVVTSAADANVGSLLGIGFPAWTGGVLRYVDGYPGGARGFAARATTLADRYGPRFAPPPLLTATAGRGGTFADGCPAVNPSVDRGA